MNVSSGAQAVSVAKQWLGTPYRWGGGHSGPVPIGTPVDCSGLVNQVFGITGTTYTQINMGSSVSNINQALPGDLVFFGSLAQGEPYHVGIYTGQGSMISAPHTGTVVRYDSVGSFGPLYGIRRLVPPTATNTPNGSNNPNMATVNFTYAQLEGIWIQAGGNPQYASIAAAVAMAESGGNSQATDNDSNGSVDRGLWQINSVHGAQSTYDVMGNARAAVAISNNGTNWSPWVTYQNGSYQRYLQSGVAPDMSVPINATNGAANQGGQGQQAVETKSIWGDIFSAGQCLQNPVGCVMQVPGEGSPGSITSNYISRLVLSIIGMVLNPLIEVTAGIMGLTAGGLLMILGLYMMIAQTQAGQRLKQATGTGMTVAGMATGQPELIAAGSRGAGGMVGAAGRQRITSIRSEQSGQRIAQRQQTAQQARMQRDLYQTQLGTTRDQLREEARHYTKQQSHEQKVSRAYQRAQLADRPRPRPQPVRKAS